MTQQVQSNGRAGSALTGFAMTLMAFTIAVGAAGTMAPDHAEAGMKTKTAKKTLKVISKGAAKFERKMRGKGKFGRALGRTVGNLGRGAGKIRNGITKVQRGVRGVVNKVCRGPCGKVLATGRKAKGKFDRFKRKVGSKVKNGFKKLGRKKMAPVGRKLIKRAQHRAAGRLAAGKVKRGVRKTFRHQVGAKVVPRYRRASQQRTTRGPLRSAARPQAFRRLR